MDSQVAVLSRNVGKIVFHQGKAVSYLRQMHRHSLRICLLPRPFISRGGQVRIDAFSAVRGDSMSRWIHSAFGMANEQQSAAFRNRTRIRSDFFLVHISRSILRDISMLKPKEESKVAYEMKTLTFPNNDAGQKRKIEEVRDHINDGWEIVSETVRNGKFNGGQAVSRCCSFPALFARGVPTEKSW